MASAILLVPYRRARLMTFLDPWADPQGAGFQVVQSFIAFYRGGLFGAGLGASRAKVFYLPEAHNDFILSVVGEELGFLGIGVLSLVFLVLIFRGIRAAAKTGDRFNSLLAAGLTILMGLEVFWNASVVLGLFPNKGMNIPIIESAQIIDDPPLEMNGIFIPLFGKSPNTTEAFQKTSRPIRIVKPAARRELNRSPVFAAARIPRKISTKKTKLRTPMPKKPSSSPTTLKMKSLCASGR
jgi:hypothetical protein